MLQRAGLVFVSVYTVVRLGSVSLGAGAPLLSMLLLSLSGTLMLLIGLSFLLFQAQVKNIFQRFSIILFEISLEIAPLIFIRLSSSESVLCISIAVAVSCTLYLIFLIKSLRKCAI